MNVNEPTDNLREKIKSRIYEMDRRETKNIKNENGKWLKMVNKTRK